MTVMICVLFNLLLFPSNSEHVHEIKDSLKAGKLEIVQNERHISLELAEVAVSIEYPSGKREQADVLMAFDPSTKLFWWEYQTRVGGRSGGFTERFLTASKMYETENALISFVIDRPSLWIRESGERYKTLEAGRAHVFSALEEQRGTIEKGSALGYRQVNLSQVLSADFGFLQGNASPLPQPKLREVNHSGDQWQVMLDGPNGDTAVVVLNDTYQPISATVNPSRRVQ